MLQPEARPVEDLLVTARENRSELRQLELMEALRGAELRLEISDEEMQRRLAEWKEPEAHYATGVFAKYAKLVSSASEGAVTG